MENSNYTVEGFEEFKAKAIEAISKMKYEDNPHIILCTAKGHEATKFHILSCPDYQQHIGFILMTDDMEEDDKFGLKNLNLN